MSWQIMRLLVEIFLSLHFFVRLRLAFKGGWWQLPVLAWLLLMLVPLFFMRRDYLPSQLTDLLISVWPIWLGFLIFFFLSSFAFDFFRLSSGALGLALGKSYWAFWAANKTVPLSLILTLLMAVYANYEAYNPRVLNISIESGRLLEGKPSLRIAQVSDIHLSRHMKHKDLLKIADLIKKAKVDILVLTGDIVDTDMSGRHDDAELLASLKPPLGSFAVLGNHELYAGEENSLNFYKKANIRLLRGEAETSGGIIIAGIDDEIFGDKANKEAPLKLLKSYENDPRFVLFLKHRPKPVKGSEGLFDLQLSGHTHGGQIFPGHIMVKLIHHYIRGLYSISSRASIYVNPGTGVWGLPYRFLSPPELTIFDLKPKPKEARLEEVQSKI